MYSYVKDFAAKARGEAVKVFDWDQAARLLGASEVTSAAAGLAEDWFYTGGDILVDGQPVPEDDCYVYLSSFWATPVLRYDDQEVECWIDAAEKPEWGPRTVWPDSARAILAELRGKQG